MLATLLPLRRLAPAPMLLGLLLVVAAGPVQARDAGYPEWQKPLHCVFGMPYVGRMVEQGETGAITEVLKTIFKREDIEFEHQHMPYMTALQKLKEGTVHCSLALKDAHDEALQGAAAIAPFDLAVIYRREDGFDGVEAMEGERVACIYGFELQRLLPVKALVQAAYDLTSVLHLLDRGHVKYVLDEETLLREALLEAQLPTSEFGITRLKSLEVHPIFADTDAGEQFQALYDRRIKQLADSGKLKKILRAGGMSDKGIDQLFTINGW